MKWLAILAALLVAGQAQAADITLAWDAATNNTDGSTLTDLAGYRVYYAPLVCAYSETTNKVIQQAILSTGAVNYAWTTNLTIKLTLTAAPYVFWATTMTTSGGESAPSSNLVARVGAPTTVKLRRL